MTPPREPRTDPLPPGWTEDGFTLLGAALYPYVKDAAEATRVFETLDTEGYTVTRKAEAADAPLREAMLTALTDEDKIAHGEAWDDDHKVGLGVCAYCDGEWPCRTQRGIDRLLAILAALTERSAT